MRADIPPGQLLLRAMQRAKDERSRREWIDFVMTVEVLANTLPARYREEAKGILFATTLSERVDGIKTLLSAATGWNPPPHPTIREALSLPTSCEECGRRFKRTRRNQRFHTKACGTAARMRKARQKRRVVSSSPDGSWLPQRGRRDGEWIGNDPNALAAYMAERLAEESGDDVSASAMLRLLDFIERATVEFNRSRKA